MISVDIHHLKLFQTHVSILADCCVRGRPIEINSILTITQRLMNSFIHMKPTHQSVTILLEHSKLLKLEQSLLQLRVSSERIQYRAIEDAIFQLVRAFVDLNPDAPKYTTYKQ